jgi:hypothetical protein
MPFVQVLEVVLALLVVLLLLEQAALTSTTAAAPATDAVSLPIILTRSPLPIHPRSPLSAQTSTAV